MQYSKVWLIMFSEEREREEEDQNRKRRALEKPSLQIHRLSPIHQVLTQSLRHLKVYHWHMETHHQSFIKWDRGKKGTKKLENESLFGCC